ncbi:MAG: hypothetical protein Q8P50_15115 [Bacillota bacterium]|nr:hypothetical protein [Bacillota bacterium]
MRPLAQVTDLTALLADGQHQPEQEQVQRINNITGGHKFAVDPTLHWALY